jgi:hypothetical protein
VGGWVGWGAHVAHRGAHATGKQGSGQHDYSAKQRGGGEREREREREGKTERVRERERE